jgi:hypothetical protein
LSYARLAQLLATSARLPFEQRAAFVQQVAVGLAAGATFLSPWRRRSTAPPAA